MGVELVGARVCLRPFHLGDIDDVFSYAGDPRVSRHLDWVPHRARADSERFVRRILEQPAGCGRTFAVEHSTSRRVIGSFEIRVINAIHRVGEIGYALSPSHWGLGYNLEAGHLLLDYGFADLHLLRVQGLCDVGNRRSYRTMEKLGMVREHVVPGATVRNGSSVDRYLYGILWREWARLCAQEYDSSAVESAAR